MKCFVLAIKLALYDRSSTNGVVLFAVIQYATKITMCVICPNIKIIFVGNVLKVWRTKLSFYLLFDAIWRKCDQIAAEAFAEIEGSFYPILGSFL